MQKIEPVYECLPGWKTPTFGTVRYDELPARAKEYLAFLEERTGIETGSISTGPERNQTIVRPGPGWRSFSHRRAGGRKSAEGSVPY